MSDRNVFLEKVRQATEQGRQFRVHVEDVPDGIGYVGAGGDVCERFAAEVTAVGGQAFLVSDVQGAREQLGRLLAEADGASAVCWQHELLDRFGLGDVLAAAGVAKLDFDLLSALALAEQREKLLACDVGITSCDLAIAETGTLVMLSRPGHERVASLVPPLHIAIIERKQIVPDLFDAFEMLGQRGAEGLPSNVTFITGPSKTGDIELQLTTGVHGPGKWQVIVIDG